MSGIRLFPDGTPPADAYLLGYADRDAELREQLVQDEVRTVNRHAERLDELVDGIRRIEKVPITDRELARMEEEDDGPFDRTVVHGLFPRGDGDSWAQAERALLARGFHNAEEEEVPEWVSSAS